MFFSQHMQLSLFGKQTNLLKRWLEDLCSERKIKKAKLDEMIFSYWAVLYFTVSIQSKLFSICLLKTFFFMFKNFWKIGCGYLPYQKFLKNWDPMCG